MYIKSQYKYKVLQVIKNENWEGKFIEVTGGGLIKPVIIGNIYRPHRVLKNVLMNLHQYYHILVFLNLK